MIGGAGIGGNGGLGSGNVTIKGGATVIATGSGNAAGIGGGGHGISGRSGPLHVSMLAGGAGGTITIKENARVTSRSEGYGAGIGGGGAELAPAGDGGTITIDLQNGGWVRAESARNGAAIGGGGIGTVGDGTARGGKSGIINIGGSANITAFTVGENSYSIGPGVDADGISPDDTDSQVTFALGAGIIVNRPAIRPLISVCIRARGSNSFVFRDIYGYIDANVSRFGWTNEYQMIWEIKRCGENNFAILHEVGYSEIGIPTDLAVGGHEIRAAVYVDFGDNKMREAVSPPIKIEVVEHAAIGGSAVIIGDKIYSAVIEADTRGIYFTPPLNTLGTFTFEWRRDGEIIFGAESYKYTITEEDISKNLYVTVKKYGAEGSVTSAAFGLIEKAPGLDTPPLVFEINDGVVTVEYTSGALYKFLSDLDPKQGWSEDNTYHFTMGAVLTLHIRMAETKTRFASEIISETVVTVAPEIPEESPPSTQPPIPPPVFPDTDTTPEPPINPPIPDIVPEQPENPQIPDIIPEQPENPPTPDIIPEPPETPSIPDITPEPPENPQIPDIVPEPPENPPTPDIAPEPPESPPIPDIPSIPQIPNITPTPTPRPAPPSDAAFDFPPRPTPTPVPRPPLSQNELNRESVTRQLRRSGDTINFPPQNENTIYLDRATIKRIAESGRNIFIAWDEIQMRLPHELIAELRDKTDDYNGLMISHSINKYDDGSVSVSLSFTVNNEQITEFSSELTVFVSLATVTEDFWWSELNHNRIAAISNGYVIGGYLNPQSGLFNINKNSTEAFSIAYIETLKRLMLYSGSFEIVDLADNAERQIMDVLPIVHNGIVLVPVRFVSLSLGAEVDWAAAEGHGPLMVSLELDEKKHNFFIGEISRGMDTAAQLNNERAYVPIGFIREFFGAVVRKNVETGDIEIIYNAPIAD